MFLLHKYVGISWNEAWFVPIVYRKWLFRRQEKWDKDMAEARKKARNKKG